MKHSLTDRAEQQGSINFKKITVLHFIWQSTSKKKLYAMKQGKQHDNMKMRGDKIPTVRATGKNTPFTKQS